MKKKFILFFTLCIISLMSISCYSTWGTIMGGLGSGVYESSSSVKERTGVDITPMGDSFYQMSDTLYDAAGY